jgi:hypothetical protein
VYEVLAVMAMGAAVWIRPKAWFDIEYAQEPACGADDPELARQM